MDVDMSTKSADQHTSPPPTDPSSTTVEPSPSTAQSSPANALASTLKTTQDQMLDTALSDVNMHAPMRAPASEELKHNQSTSPLSTNNHPSLQRLPALPDVKNEEVLDVRTIIQRHVAPLIEEIRTARMTRYTADAVAEYYQRKLVVAMDASRELGTDSSRTLQTRLHDDAVALRTEVDATRAENKALRDEKQALVERIAQRDRSLADDAIELARLRAVAAEVPGLHARVAAAQTERNAAAARANDEASRRATRAEADAAALRALNEDVVRLTSQLTKARCDNDAAAAAANDAARASEVSARESRETITALRADSVRMQQFIEKLQSDLATTRGAADQLDASFRAEVEQLNKMCEIHEQRATEAEQRARDYEEALTQEKELAQRRAASKPTKTGLAPHVDVLLKDMEQALEARWHLLEQQKSEMERAREAEMRLIANKEKLEREMKDARFDAEQSRKEALRLRSQVEAQGEEITRLRRQLDAPREQSARPSVDRFMQTPVAGSASAGLQTSSSPQPWPAVLTSRRVSASPMDIGPESVIPTHYIASPQATLPEDFTRTMREVSEIRRRHERLLESLRDNRVSFG